MRTWPYTECRYIPVLHVVVCGEHKGPRDECGRAAWPINRRNDGAPRSASSSAIAGYRIYRSTSSGTEAFLTSVGLVNGYPTTGPTNATAHRYQVSGRGPSLADRQRYEDPRWCSRE